MTEQASYNRATITPSDLSQSFYGRTGEAAALLARATSWVYKAASINASACSRVPMRLYKPARSSRKSIERQRSAMLRDPSRVGRKAARYADSAEEVEEITDHPALDLLQQANTHDNGYELLELVYFCQELTGNAYLWASRAGNGRGEPMELWPMYPQWTRIIASREMIVGGYAYGRQRGDETIFDPDEVIHFRHRLDPSSPLYGMSWLRAALVDADILTASRQSELAMFENGARPDYAFVAEEQLTTTQVEQIDGELRKKFKGPDKRGKVAILSGGKSILPLNFSPREMEYIAGQEWTRDTIMALADIPKSIYTSDDVNLANAQVGERMHARLAVLPRVHRLTDTLTARLLPMYGVADGEMWFACDDPTPDDQALRRDTNVAYVNGGIISINEARAEEGYDPVDDGDELRVAGQPIAGPYTINVVDGAADADAGDAGEARPAASPAEVVALVAQVTAGDVPAESAVAIIVSLWGFDDAGARRIIGPAASLREERVETADAIAEPAEPEEDDEPEPEPDGKASTVADCATVGCDHGAKMSDLYGCKAALADDSDFRQHAAAEYAAALETYFVRQANAVARAIRENGTGDFRLASVPTPKSMKAAEQWDAALLAILQKFSTEPIALGGKDALLALTAAGAIEPGQEFNVENPRIAEFLERHTLHLSRTATAINETSEAAVLRVIREGIDAAQTPKQMADTISDTLGGVSRNRAVTIARTEHARAYGMGRQAQWAGTGLVSRKQWVVSPDACEFCRAMKGREVALGAPFVARGSTLTGTAGGSLSNDYSDVQSEPLHPNCKCTTIAVLGSGEETDTLRGEEG